MQPYSPMCYLLVHYTTTVDELDLTLTLTLTPGWPRNHHNHQARCAHPTLLLAVCTWKGRVDHLWQLLHYVNYWYCIKDLLRRTCNVVSLVTLRWTRDDSAAKSKVLKATLREGKETNSKQPLPSLHVLVLKYKARFHMLCQYFYRLCDRQIMCSVAPIHWSCRFVDKPQRNNKQMDKFLNL